MSTTLRPHRPHRTRQHDDLAAVDLAVSLYDLRVAATRARFTTADEYADFTRALARVQETAVGTT